MRTMTGYINILLIFCILLICGIHTNLSAQTIDNSRTNPLTNLKIKILRVAHDTIVLEHVSIVPTTVSIDSISKNDYWIDYNNAILYWIHKPSIKTIQIKYRVFPYKLNMQTQRMSFDSLMNFSVIRPMLVPSEKRELINFGNIKADGSFGREIGFGNNQSAVLNSELNVRLSGLLGDSIQLEAAIADNNIPFQPEGNTQQLNQFDEVYVRFKKNNWQLDLGDMDLRQNNSYFLNFYKRLQGIQFKDDYKIAKNMVAKTLVNGAIAKGKFTQNIIVPVEGNQGPYRLSGVNNEMYFIVLSNSERVFIDGKLLQRGEDQDYVINYNTAEISFTPKQMITKDSRIHVEFEYADKNFLNTNIYASQQINIKKKLKINIGYLNNSDAKNSPITQSLDTKQKQFLFNVGDSIQNALYPSIIMDTAFSNNKILYKKIFIEEGNNMVDSFYQYSTNKDSAVYSIAFTDVGLNHGNYILDVSNANGRVYKYVAPINGIRQGRFEPVLQLIAPKKQELFNVGLQYQISKNTNAELEVATSNYDINTFSSLHQKDNRGYAAKIKITDDRKISKRKIWYNNLDYEYVQDRFKSLERLRNIEFERDWSLPVSINSVTENIGKFTTGIKDSMGNYLQYQFTTYNRSDEYNGIQNRIKQIQNKKNWNFQNEISLTNFNSTVNKGFFIRPNINISKTFPKLKNWSLGAAYSIEHNENRSKFYDTLNPVSFSFDILSMYAKSNAAKLNKYAITYFTRTDRYPINNQFLKGDRSNNINVQIELFKNEKHQFYLNTTYRRLKNFNDSISINKTDHTILSRVEYRINVWKGFFKGYMLYEMGTGQEQKREYTFVEVPTGRGTHTWIDYNGDGVQQLNEFEIAAFVDQANFIKLFTPTNQYIKANYNTFTYNVFLDPRVFWNQKTIKGMKKLVAKFNLSSSLNINKKATANNHFDFNPFNFINAQSELITFNKDMAHTISFNRYSSSWGLDVSNTMNAAKALLNYGYETHERNQWNIRLRKKISNTLMLNISTVMGYNKLSTENSEFQNKNYKIDKLSVEPSLSFVRKTNFRLNANYKFQQKQNAVIYGGEKSISNAAQLETKYNILQDGAIALKFTYDHIKFDAVNKLQNTVQYIMLDGLQTGQNFLWNITLTKRLFENLEVNIQYDGRKAGDAKTVHSGRASIRAIL